MSINQVFPSETLVSAFSALSVEEVVRLREICKHWSVIVDGTQNLLRVLDLSEVDLDLETAQSAVE